MNSVQRLQVIQGMDKRAMAQFGKDVAWGMIPGSGFVDAAKSFRNGRIWGGLGNMAMGALSFVPGLGLAGGLAKGVGRGLVKGLGRAGLAAARTKAIPTIGKAMQVGSYGVHAGGGIAANAAKGLGKTVTGLKPVQTLTSSAPGRAVQSFGQWTGKNQGKAIAGGMAGQMGGNYLQGAADSAAAATRATQQGMQRSMQQMYQRPVFQDPVWSSPVPNPNMGFM